MTQLTRIELGNNIEESHMRNRQLIAGWVYEKGSEDKVIEIRERDGKSFVVINDYEKMRELIGNLLAEVQRIKSEGDYETAKKLVEKYGVKVNEKIHKEVKERYAKLNLAPYKGFVNPIYTPVFEGEKLVDVIVSYNENFVEQMLRYGKEHSHLQVFN